MGQYGFGDDLWTAAKGQARAALIERAKVRGMMPYSELVKQIASIQFEAYDHRLFHLLGEISTEEDTAGRGMLSAIVVHKTGDMEPGTGFFELADKLGRHTSDKTKCWVEEIKRIYQHWGTP